MPYDHGRLLDPVCEENIVLGKDWLNACLSNGFSPPVDAFPVYRAGAFMESLSSLLKLDSSFSFRPATLHTIFGFSLPICYGTGSGRVRVAEGAREKSGSGSEELRSGQEAEGLGFNSCVAPSCTQVSYFGKPISQKRKREEPKLIFRLEIQEETSEYIY